jgi:hypothetical protein
MGFCRIGLDLRNILLSRTIPGLDLKICHLIQSNPMGFCRIGLELRNILLSRIIPGLDLKINLINMYFLLQFLFHLWYKGSACITFQLAGRPPRIFSEQIFKEGAGVAFHNNQSSIQNEFVRC